MKKLLRDPLFWGGLALRLVVIFTVLPVSVMEWYAPFLNSSIGQLNIDPWTIWLGEDGDLQAFPYGYVMWLAFLPLTIVCKLAGLPLYFGYMFTLFIVDVGLLAIFRKMFPSRARVVFLAYWLSPIVLVASYVHGYNDLVPILFLVLSLYFARRLNLFLAGVFCVLAISAKLSMVLALPFYAVYFMQSRALHHLVPGFLKGAAIAWVVFGFPFMFSNAALKMVLSNPEMGKVYQFALPIGQSVSVYVVPLLYLVMIYSAWRIRRMNFELFQSLLGIAFLLVVLLTPASLGWFIWAVPLLVNYQATSGRVAIVLSAVFSAFYVLSTLLVPPYLPFVRISDTDMLESIRYIEPHLVSFVHTTMVAVGIVLALRIWRDNVIKNAYFRISRKPFVIGIAGDSGSGKDTLADALQGLFGDHSVSKLSGDDYHLWDRQKPIWQAMTHLNPMANDLEGFANDLVALIDGKSIMLRHYDHKTGIRSAQIQVKSNDFIIASGLHTLYLPILRESVNLSIYLDIDEGLRRHLKQLRDIGQRGHSVEQVRSAFTRREPDSEKFIRPQGAYAELVLSLHPIHPGMLDEPDEKRPLRFKLQARSKSGLNEASLTRVLVGVCGLHVDMATSNDGSEVELTIEGETSAEDVALAAQMLCPRAVEVLDIKPKWADGILGLMQLIALSHVNQALTKRFL